jgi:hypothetical protein
MPFVMGGRPDAVLEKSVVPSGFPFDHGAFAVGRLRAGPLTQPLLSWVPGMGTPFDCALGLDVTVDVDELDDVDDTDDEEFVRGSVFRCMNMLIPRASSDGFIEFGGWPPLIHPGRLRFAKLGGFATAVMETARREMGEAPGDRGQ